MKRRHLLIAAATAPLAALVACSAESDGPTAVTPVEIDPATTCDLDGMLLADYPGPKAQIHYAGAAAPVFFCDTTEMFAQLLRPEQVRPVRAAFVQDMAKADWGRPLGHWIDARTGFYVVGSRRLGSMGVTIASFATRDAAEAFAKEYGGLAMAYAEVKPEMADLRGGAQHDQRM